MLQPVRPRTTGCGECLRTGGRWVHLRPCLTCGEVGCCNDSPGRHAERHARTADHPLLQSLEPCEAWVWCVADGFYVSRVELARRAAELDSVDVAR
jgi:hypothetical protein